MTGHVPAVMSYFKQDKMNQGLSKDVLIPLELDLLVIDLLLASPKVGLFKQK